ncbi:MAG: phosphate ABC transporter permease PstA [Gammaproteobacteria bacterium]|nr:phosphate ABC transporter permease PstA [Gammaproteobacteria bacterium]MCW8987485.1 phosphate ABC transporter permease PstA [Gammaproteobacteria bacterium]
MIKKWFKSGDPWIWLNAAAVSASLIIVLGLLALIAVKGLSHFWPKSVMQAQYVQATATNSNPESLRIIGEVHNQEEVTLEALHGMGVHLELDALTATRILLKTGNRDISGADFKWMLQPYLKDEQYPENIVVLERREWGNFYGFLKSVKSDNKTVASEDTAWQELETQLERAELIYKQIREIEKDDIGSINYGMEQIRLGKRRLELEKEDTPERIQKLDLERKQLEKEYAVLEQDLKKLYKKFNRDSIIAETMSGQQIEIPLSKIVRAYRPNSLNIFQKIILYFEKLWEFVADEPREANTEGGIFPAIFGTVMMVLLMSVLVTPFGVIAAVYLREYAKQGAFTRTIRIAVNNLAGVPSIVYGVFGLGFFVYFLGGNLDQLFYPEALPSPTFGTPGILWSSLTLAILTVPVVIVATEEGLSRIPRSIREGSLALGATKAETLWRTILPMATPSMMTGMILAIARAAGEVAPLMLVGVVKLAPSLPLDTNAPFFHLERKFMHLGFHIYDVGFQSPNVEAARPLVYATALLLIAVIVLLNLSAIYIRNRLREQYRSLES